MRDILFDNNRAWAEAKQAVDPDFFPTLSKGQRPHYLWIGCSDSRVAPNLLMDKDLGEVFVQRNIANQVLSDDDNTMAVLEYAVNELEVSEIIVCGHYACGGVNATLQNKLKDESSPIYRWLSPLSRLAERYQDYLNQLAPEKRADALAELNLAYQISNLLERDIIAQRWRQNHNLLIRGLMFEFASGRLLDMGINIASSEDSQKFQTTQLTQFGRSAKEDSLEA